MNYTSRGKFTELCLVTVLVDATSRKFGTRARLKTLEEPIEVFVIERVRFENVFLTVAMALKLKLRV